MDFTKLNSTDTHDEGSWLHLEHPATGQPLYLGEGNSITTDKTDKPCRVRVRGNRSDAVKRVTDAKARQDELHAARFMRAGDKEAARLVSQNVQARDQYNLDLLVATVSDWENIVVTEGQKPAQFTTDNVLSALSHPQFMIAIFKRSADEAALFPNAPTG